MHTAFGVLPQFIMIRIVQQSLYIYIATLYFKATVDYYYILHHFNLIPKCYCVC